VIYVTNRPYVYVRLTPLKLLFCHGKKDYL
jgi:hypothetical protein